MTIAVQLGFVAGALTSAVLNLADAFPARRILWVSAVCAALANAAIALADGPGVAIPLRFLTGACLAGVYPTALKITSTWFRSGRGAALGITLTVVTIWLVPVLRDSVGWRWTFASLAPGPALGALAMLYLRRLPESRLIAGGRG